MKMKSIIIGLILACPCLLFSQTTGQLAFTHNGQNTTRYELKIDNAAPVVVASTPLMGTPGDLTVPLPTLAPGTRTLILSACNATACAASQPLVLQIPTAPANLRITITIQIGGD